MGETTTTRMDIGLLGAKRGSRARDVRGEGGIEPERKKYVVKPD